jgi:hypothetical protein
MLANAVHSAEAQRTRRGESPICEIRNPNLFHFAPLW